MSRLLGLSGVVIRDLENELSRAEGRIALLEEALRTVEWAEQLCHICEQSEWVGHTDICNVGIALRGSS